MHIRGQNSAYISILTMVHQMHTPQSVTWYGGFDT